jgi:hypothetical protein
MSLKLELFEAHLIEYRDRYPTRFALIEVFAMVRFSTRRPRSFLGRLTQTCRSVELVIPLRFCCLFIYLEGIQQGGRGSCAVKKVAVARAEKPVVNNSI